MQITPAASIPASRPRQVSGEAPALDFSTVDTVEEAVLLPALNGASLQVMLASLQAEAKWNVSLTSLQQMTWNDGASGGTMRHHGQSTNMSTVELSGSGTLGGVPIEETWTLDKDNGVVRIEGTIGYSHESLVLHDGDDGRQHLDGQVGDIEVHEVLERSPGRLTIDGTLGGVDIHQGLTINDDQMPASFQPPLVINDVMVVEGSLGGAPISLNADAVCPPNMPVVTYQEVGNIAGTAVQTNHTLQITGLPSREI